MSKPSIKLPKPTRLKRFAQVSTRWDGVVDELKRNPGTWYRIKGANLNDVVTMRGSHVLALRPHKLEVRVRRQRHADRKVFARYVGPRH